MSSIYEFVKEQRENYRSRTIEITEGYDFSQYQTLRTIELYHNSKFETGNKDSLLREKPFYNICKFRVNVATRATDLDTKNVKVKSEKLGADDAAFLLNLKNRNWMKQSAFAVFLNKFGHVRAKYGGALVKKTEQHGDLALHIMQWRNMITDQVDIQAGVKIERHYYTPADLKTSPPSGWTNIDRAIETAKKSQQATAGKSPGKQNITPGAYIEVYEVHGVLPTCYLAGTSDKYPETYGSEDSYERMMVAVVLDESDKDTVNGVTLFAGIEEADPYKYLSYEEVEGRGLGVGVVEDLFEAQVWTNYSVKQKKDILDLAGKIIFQTADQNIAAKNVLTDIESGTILTHALNAPITQVNNVPAGIGGLAQLMSDWNEQAQNVTSTYPAILGQTPPHGTAFRLQAGLVNEASALFEYRRQEAGLFIQEIYRDWILPFLVKQMRNSKEIIADLDAEELQMLSDAKAAFEALSFAKKQVLSGKLVSQQDLEAIKQAAKTHALSARRHGFNEFAKIFEDWAGTVDVDTVGEQKDTQAILSWLFQLFGAIAQNPMLLQNPTMARLFNEIVETAGMSPALQQAGQAQQQPEMQPGQGVQSASQPAAPFPPQPTPKTAPILNATAK
jgi:hypothetical protein